MNQTQAYDVIERIAAAYTQFDLKGKIGEKRIEIWLEALSVMPYEQVISNLKHHIATSKFPPTIAEIAATDHVESDFLDLHKQWERESRYANRKH